MLKQKNYQQRKQIRIDIRLLIFGLSRLMIMNRTETKSRLSMWDYFEKSIKNKV